MSFTTEDLKKLDQAIASGTLLVRFADREVRYQTSSELLKVRDAIRRELGITPRRRIVGYYDKGLNS